MSRYMKAMTVCCAAVLALSLAGCGGGGGGGGGDASAPAPTPSTGPEPVKVDGGLIAEAIEEGTPQSSADAPFTVDGAKLTENPVTADVTTDDFAKSENSVAPIEGWAGSVYRHSETGGKVVTTVVTYTDIEPPTAQAYSEYYSESDAGTRDAVASADADGVLTFNNGDLDGHRMLFGFDFSDLTPDDDTSFEDDTTTPDVDESMVSRKGTFHGIPGTFACTAGCEITLDADGHLSGAEGTWTFTPDEAPAGSPHMVQGVVPDPEYMNLAYWLKSTEADDGTISYEIGTLAQSNEPRYGSTGSLTGKATYAGPATGLYMRNTFAPDGKTTPAAAGQFTANAELTAYFGQDENIAPNLVDTISGTVDDFKDSAGNPIGTDWVLSLDKADTDNPSDGTFAGVSTGKSAAGTGPAGTWSGQFEGDNTEGATPSATTGVFHGHFIDGHVAGAFAAKEKK